MSKSGRDVVVTGVGPVTCVGIGRDAFWQSLLSARSNAVMCELAVDVGRSAALPLARLQGNEIDGAAARHTAYLRSQECEPNRDLVYAMTAIDLAIKDARLQYDPGDNRVGMVQVFEAPGTEAAVGRMFDLFRQPPPSSSGPPPLYEMLAPSFYQMQPFLYVHLAAKAFSLHGFCTSVHNACSSGAFAIETAAQQIRGGAADAMIVVGGEAFDTAVRIEWFRRLGMYATSPRMVPFSDAPTGFYVGEGAAALVLEPMEQAEKRGATIYARYAAGAFTHQAWKQTLPDAKAARLRGVIGAALEQAGASPEDLDLIIPHGAATGLSDAYEATCAEQAGIGPARGTMATAIKANVGHMLAAAGLIEAIGLMLAMRHQCVPPTIGADPAHTQFPVPLATMAVERRVGLALKTFTGFTGHDAALVFARPRATH